MTDEETYTYSRTVPADVGRLILLALKDNTISCRAKLSGGGHWFAHRASTMTIFVKPERQRRLDKFVDRFDRK